MNNTIPSPNAPASYRAWMQMRTETLDLQRGRLRDDLSPEMPHVAAYLVARAEFRAALEAIGQTREGRAEAHGIIIRAEARYLEHVIETLRGE